MTKKILLIPEKILEKLGWDEITLLELEFIEDIGWTIKQSDVAASKFPGHIVSDELQRSK